MTPLVIARVLQFLSCMTLLAVPAFTTWIAPPRLLPGPAGATLQKCFFRVLAASLLLALFSALAVFLLTANSLIAETDTSLNAILLQTRFGHLLIVRMAILAIFASLLFTRSPLLPVSLLTLATLAWTGHAAAGSISPLQPATDALHLLAAGVWPGTLLPLILFLFVVRTDTAADQMQRTRTIIKRFSASSLLAVAILTLTGCANACSLVGSLHALLTTSYGHLLILKISFFLILLLPASRNLLGLSPKLTAASLPELKRNIAVELFLALAIILIVSILGLLPPPGHC